jgi:brefeldin A-resistance guanine nucleotide exchange factor 1
VPRHAPRVGAAHGGTAWRGASSSPRALLTPLTLLPLQTNDSSSPSSSLDPSTVLNSKSSKRRLLEGASAFNLKPKVGLKYLEEHGLIYAEQPPIPRPESLAKFFRSAPKLDKKVLGEFISRPEQLEVLKAFMQGLDFKGVRCFPPLPSRLYVSPSKPELMFAADLYLQKIICDALRDLLEGFRLPGEAQQIARITETFAEVYFATDPPEIKSQDAVYVLSYSIILLNTDQHNPQVQVRRFSFSFLLSC